MHNFIEIFRLVYFWDITIQVYLKIHTAILATTSTPLSSSGESWAAPIRAIPTTYVTQSDKNGLIVGKYIRSLNSMHPYCFVSYNNSVSFKLNYAEVLKVLNSYYVYTKTSNFEIMVKIWWAISPFLSDQITYLAHSVFLMDGVGR